MWLLVLYLETSVENRLLALLFGQFLEVRHWFPQLPICLSIQLVSFYKYRSDFVSTEDECHIGWYSLIRYQLNYIANPQLARRFLNHSIFGKDIVKGTICLFVFDIPLVIFVSLLQHRQEKDEHQGGDVRKK